MYPIAPYCRKKRQHRNAAQIMSLIHNSNSIKTAHRHNPLHLLAPHHPFLEV